MKTGNLKNEKSNEFQHFNVLAVPCDRAFIISADKKEEFLSQKPNLKIRQRNAEKLRLLKEKILQSKKSSQQQFSVLAVPCDRAFVVSADKREEFLSQKPNLKIRQKNEENVRVFIENNLVDKAPVKKIGQKKIKLN